MGQGWHTALLLSLLLLSACGKKQQDITRWNSFPVAVYADSSVASNPEALSDFHDAMSFWEAKAGRQLFQYQGVWTGASYTGSATNPDSILANVLLFKSPWDFSPNLAGQTVVRSTDHEINSSIMMINPFISYCSGDCTGQNNLTSQRKTFTHELGHFLGMAHIEDENNIMYPSIQVGGSLSQISVDTQALQSLTE